MGCNFRHWGDGSEMGGSRDEVYLQVGGGRGGHARAALIGFSQGVFCICEGERSIGFKLASSIFLFLCLQFKSSLCSQACMGPAVMLVVIK